MSEYLEINELLLSRLEDRFPTKSAFNIWFGNFELISMTEQKAVFKTQTDLKKGIIEKRYMDILRDALEEVIGFAVEIEITAPPPGSVEIPIVDEKPLVPLGEEEKKEAEERKLMIDSFLNDTESPHNKKLLSEYTFDTFIEGSSNKFAKAACLAVVNEPTYYNPLFIYGGSGLGKTHLLYAVINELKKRNSKQKIVYCKCEDFLNELVEALEKNKIPAFKEKYRKADVLLIDDVQFIAGKVATQEEFFHTFSSLYEADKQIILTSDRPPKEIRPLEDRLRSRFEGGLLADVQPPSFELRIAIIKKKASSMNLLISNEMVNYIAERLHSNIRQIEGVLKRLYAQNSMSSSPITKESIDQAISVIDPGNIPTEALVEKILTVVSKYYGVPVEHIKSKKKTDSIANARHMSIYLIRELTNLSYKETANIFGRDYSTAIASFTKIETNVKTMHKTAIEVKKLIKEIKEN